MQCRERSGRQGRSAGCAERRESGAGVERVAAKSEPLTRRQIPIRGRQELLPLTSGRHLDSRVRKGFRRKPPSVHTSTDSHMLLRIPTCRLSHFYRFPQLLRIPTCRLSHFYRFPHVIAHPNLQALARLSWLQHPHCQRIEEELVGDGGEDDRPRGKERSPPSSRSDQVRCTVPTKFLRNQFFASIGLPKVQLDCPSVAQWDYFITFAVEVRF